MLKTFWKANSATQKSLNHQRLNSNISFFVCGVVWCGVVRCGVVEREREGKKKSRRVGLGLNFNFLPFITKF